jgi:hypothetical protein
MNNEKLLTDGPAEGIATPVIAYKCRSCNCTLTAKEFASWVGCDACEGESMIAVEPASPVQLDDPCKMTDAQYEEYIYGPNRAKWLTNDPAAPVVAGVLSYEEHRQACMFNLPAYVFGSSPRNPPPAESKASQPTPVVAQPKKMNSLQMATIYGTGMNLYYAAKLVSDTFTRGNNPTEAQLNRLAGCLEGFEFHFTPTKLDEMDAELTAQPAPIPSDQKECDHSKCIHLTTSVCCVCGDFKVKPAAALPVGQKDGLALIQQERHRQVESENWTPEHDDEHDGGEIGMAAFAYIEASRAIVFGQNPLKTHAVGAWPWEAKWFKPGNDAVRCLVKAGALLAAEIDRLQRLEAKGGTN